jgi:hypothetical protein
VAGWGPRWRRPLGGHSALAPSATVAVAADGAGGPKTARPAGDARAVKARYTRPEAARPIRAAESRTTAPSSTAPVTMNFVAEV